MADARTNARIEPIEPKAISDADLTTITHSLALQIRRLLHTEYYVQTGSLKQRVARYLLKLASTPLAVIDETGRTTIAATNELIAEGTGSVRESVAMAMLDLHYTSHVSLDHGHIVILDLPGLDAIANGS